MANGIKRFKELAKDYINNPKILRTMLKYAQEWCETLQAENAKLREQLTDQTVEKFQEIIRNQCDEISALKVRIAELEEQLYERFDEQADMEAGK